MNNQVKRKGLFAVADWLIVHKTYAYIPSQVGTTSYSTIIVFVCGVCNKCLFKVLVVTRDAQIGFRLFGGKEKTYSAC